MREAPQQGSTRGSTGWLSAALVLVAATAGNEALPLLFGTGERATCDWGFLYVTLKFVLLPLFSFILCTVASFAIFRRSSVSPAAVFTGLLGLAYLISLYFWPLPWLP